MADTEQSERTEPPSQRRLDQARERGQVPRSRELGNFATMIGGSATLVVLGGWAAGRMAEVMRAGLSVTPQQLADPLSMLGTLGMATRSMIGMLLPVFAAVVVLLFAAAIALGGWNISLEPMIPDFSRLSPLEGIKRLFGVQGAGELGKALLKVLVVGGVCAGVAMHLFGDVMGVGHMAPRAAIGRGAYLVALAFVMLSASLSVVALVDVPLQLFQYHRNLRMTRQEVRDEAKESDGNPETKRRIRQVQQAIAA